MLRREFSTVLVRVAWRRWASVAPIHWKAPSTPSASRAASALADMTFIRSISEGVQIWPSMYASPRPMSTSLTMRTSACASRTRMTAAHGASGVVSPTLNSWPVGRITRSEPFLIHVRQKASKSCLQRACMKFMRGLRERASTLPSHGTLAPRPLAAAIPALRPSSWKPYPHHAPASHTPPVPFTRASAACAAGARSVKTG
mmetsp:Transcript_12587/g.52962  ORF Transcript_12587/g.52962 Transcript_12587/m.52962 type:complete len:201 (+) Transcript_12587:2529-3131(+)